MNWGTVAALVMAFVAVAGLVNERHQRNKERERGLDEVVTERLKILLTGPAAVVNEYDEQGQVLVAHLREVINQRDQLGIEVEELRGQVTRLEKREVRRQREIDRLNKRIAELERANGCV